MASTRPCLALLLASTLGAAALLAQARSLRSYGVADGLPGERVNCLYQDRDGYLWLGTWEGLARFDGAAFRHYRAGLWFPIVNAVVEDAAGRLWVATNGGGIARLLEPRQDRAGPEAAPCFRSYHVDRAREADVVDVLVCDPAGVLWCGTQAGVYRVDLDRAGEPHCTPVVTDDATVHSGAAAVDAAGRVWLGLARSVLTIDRHGAQRQPLPPGASDGGVQALVTAGDRVWLASATHLYRGSVAARSVEDWDPLPVALVPGQRIEALAASPDGDLWIGTTLGLEPRPTTTAAGRDPRTTPSWTRRLAGTAVHAVLRDGAANLWAAAWPVGLVRLAPTPIRSWTTLDGLPHASVHHLVLAHDDRVVATTSLGMVAVRDGQVQPIAGSAAAPFANVGMGLCQDPGGAWWLGTERGLYRVRDAGLDLGCAQPLAGATDGIFGGLYLDHDAVWFTSVTGQVGMVTDLAGEPRVVRPAELRLPDTPPRAFLRDSRGDLWLLPYDGLFRWRAGRLAAIAPPPGLDRIQARCLYEDRAHRLWLGTRAHGVWRSDDWATTDAAPTFRGYGAGQGLPSEAVWAITEDRRGRLYLASGRGLVRLEPDTGRVTAFTSAAGLAGDTVMHCVTDGAGRIWAATSGGISMLDPDLPEPAVVAPATWLTRVRVAGRELPLPERGTTAPPPLVLGPADHNLGIEFTAPWLSDEGPLRFQCRLAEHDTGWSAPAVARSVHFPELPPGDYRFEVRALVADAVGAPASLQFRIEPPVWRRPWFQLLGMVAVAAAMAVVWWNRVRQRRAAARLRQQIALDIHDEMGAGLAQIAIQAELARRGADATATGHLAETAALARTLRESMSDVVWAIDPQQDSVGDLVRRLRQVATNLLAAEDVRVELALPEPGPLARVVLAPDRRRHLLLAAKELLTNVARHAQATQVRVALTVAADGIVLAVRDDGRGFDPGQARPGHGLTSLRQRARLLDAEFTLRSQPGSGTEAELRVPLR